MLDGAAPFDAAVVTNAAVVGEGVELGVPVPLGVAPAVGVDLAVDIAVVGVLVMVVAGVDVGVELGDGQIASWKYWSYDVASTPGTYVSSSARPSSDTIHVPQQYAEPFCAAAQANPAVRIDTLAVGTDSSIW